MDASTLDQLENVIFVEHPIANGVESDILRFMQFGRHDECLCVVGPTGVGKSRMSKRVKSRMISRLNSGWLHSHSYPLDIEAPSQTKKEFPWRSFLEEILLLLGEVDLTRKIDLEHAEKCRKSGVRPPPVSKLTIGQLERLIRLRVEVLKPVAIIIDEAQNLVEGLSFSDRKANVNRLKNWANTMDTKFILFGTHESREFFNLNEQLTRRITPVYFPRYAKNKDEMADFGSFYLGILKELDLNMDPKINKDFTFIYNHSLGCPGLLATWIYKSIETAIWQKSSRITYDIFMKNRFSKTRLEVMEKAIKNFEVEYQASLSDFNPDLIQADSPPEQLIIDYTSKPTQHGNPKPGKQHPRRFVTHDA